MYSKNSPHTIRDLFNQIATRYDLANAILSFLLYKPWNRSLIQKVLNTTSPSVFVDLCSGTGEIALNYLRKAPLACHAYLIDFSPNMLEQARCKAAQLSLDRHQLTYLEADVQHLPLSNQSADCATLAYGLRNVENPAQCLKEAFRILKPGGCLGILELTRPASSFLRLGHKLYLKSCLPLIGKWLTNNQEAYQYLHESIQTFISPEEIQQLLFTQGFSSIKSYSLAKGIATLLIGYKSS